MAMRYFTHQRLTYVQSACYPGIYTREVGNDFRNSGSVFNGHFSGK